MRYNYRDRQRGSIFLGIYLGTLGLLFSPWIVASVIIGINKLWRML